jgi:thioredoxin reductase (NADPH)
MTASKHSQTNPAATAPIRTDAVIVGAGPVGLFQVFELGLLALEAHVIDSMGQVGGQCAELYPDKPIYDIPALPVCGAQELIERLMEQIKPFNPSFHLGQTVVEVQPQTDGRFIVRTSADTVFDTGAVIIAGGLGAFLPKKLRSPNADALEGHSLHYKVGNPALFRDRDIVIAGGGDSALDWALNLVDVARSVVLLHRSQDFRAAPASVLKMQALCDEYRMQFLEAEIAGLEADGNQLKALLVRSRDGVTRHLDAEQLLVFWGLHPKLGPIAEWGLGLHKNQIEVDTEAFRTNVPGIFAVGDINTYPGKKKLILSGFHEAALAAFGVKAYLQPNEKVHLQYTTTSTALHRRLGVESVAA